MIDRILSLLLVVSLGCTSCSLAVASHQPINIIPSDPRAEVYVDGNLIGTGPQTVDLDKSESHSAMAKCGDSAGTGEIRTSLSTTGVLDLIGGIIILVPFIGFVSPGAWKLSPTTLSVAVPDASDCDPESAA